MKDHGILSGIHLPRLPFRALWCFCFGHQIEVAVKWNNTYVETCLRCGAWEKYAVGTNERVDCGRK